jgi:hypothetical protein
MLAGQAIPVPSADEIESRLASFSAQARTEHVAAMERTMRERFRNFEGMTEESAAEYREQHEAEWEAEDKELRDAMEQKISDYSARLYEEYHNQKNNQEMLAFSLARFSPASMFQLVAMKLAGTDTGLKRRYEDAMKSYRDQYTKFIEQKGGGGRTFRISVGRGSSEAKSVPPQKINISEMPQFQDPTYTFGDTLAASLIDLGMLAIFNILAFVGAFVAFLRFDMR